MKFQKWYSTYNHPDGWHFIIKYDGPAGYYVYVYYYPETFAEDAAHLGSCPSHQEDHLQDTLEMAQRFSFRKFGVPLDSWTEIV